MHQPSSLDNVDDGPDEPDLDAVAAAEKTEACPLPLSHDRIALLRASWIQAASHNLEL